MALAMVERSRRHRALQQDLDYLDHQLSQALEHLRDFYVTLDLVPPMVTDASW